MKTSRLLIGAAVFGGWMIASPTLTAQEMDPKPGPPPAPREREMQRDARPGSPGRDFHPQAMGNRPMWRMMRGPDGRAGQRAPLAFQGMRGGWGRGWMGMRPGGMRMHRGAMGINRGYMGMRPGDMGMPRGGMRMNPENKGMKPGVARQDGAGLPQVAKVRHLKQAAEHLKAAGYMEQAEKAGKEADKLAAEVRRNSEPKGAPDQSAEVEKMRRELEELRGQLRRLKAETAPRRDAPQTNPPAAPAPPPAREPVR